MSAKGTISTTVFVLDHKHDEAAKEWAMGARTFRGKEGQLAIDFDNDDADWFEDELKALKEELATIPIPLDAWECWVYYESYEHLAEDGGIIEVEIRNGKVAALRTSYLEMRDAEPWFEFDMKEEA